MKRVILTGFEPFGDYKFNPTQDITKEYDGKKIEDIEVIGLVLPCTYYGAYSYLKDFTKSLAPDAILSLGLSSSVKGFRFERFGKNLMDGKYKDANGFNPKGMPIIEGGKEIYGVNSSIGFLATNILNLPFEISENADAFICNSLIYLTSMEIAEKRLSIKNAFVHIPWTSDYAGKIKISKDKITITKDELRKGIEAIVLAMTN